MIDGNPETQGGDGGGFEFRFGNNTVKGYVLIGGVVDGVVGLAAVACLARTFFRGNSKAERPPRRAEVLTNNKEGGNDESGVVMVRKRWGAVDDFRPPRAVENDLRTLGTKRKRSVYPCLTAAPVNDTCLV